MAMLKLIIAPLRRCFYVTIMKEVQGSMWGNYDSYRCCFNGV